MQEMCYKMIKEEEIKRKQAEILVLELQQENKELKETIKDLKELVRFLKETVEQYTKK